jgi:AraC family transcriptional regulator of arabinose operon
MKRASRSVPQDMSKTTRTRRAASGVVFGDVIYAAGGTHGPRVQVAHQLVLVLTGEARVRVDGAEIVVPARHAGLFQPGRREEFRFSVKGPTHHAWCSVRPGLVSGSLRDACARAPAVQRLSRRLEMLVELGLSVPRHAGGISDPLIEALGLAALQEYVFFGRMGRDAAPEPDALWRALEWTAQLGDRPADVATMARASGVSASQLTKLFRVHLDTTPMRHVWKTRTERGVQLLQETGLSIAEAAYRCGFQTPFHFSRCVRLHFGAAPREVRKS